MSADSVGHRPEAAWAFDAGVTDCFEDMLRRSIPQYDVMRSAVQSLAVRYRQPKTDIVSLGASRGDDVAPLVDKWGATNRFVCVEVSEPMLEVLRSRFSGMIESGVMRVLNTDLREDFPHADASVILSILTLQFVPIEHRQKVVRAAWKCLQPGGAFVVVEKVLGATAELDAALVEQYLAMKAANGYSQEDIDRKRLSLEGVLVPLTAEWNETLLRRCGFADVECFWRWMNFAGWVAVR